MNFSDIDAYNSILYSALNLIYPYKFKKMHNELSYDVHLHVNCSKIENLKKLYVKISREGG